MRFWRAMAYLWALPNTLVGLIFLPLVLLTGGRASIRDGVLEICGGAADIFLRRCTLLKGGASAMTLGHVIIARDQQCLDMSRGHERIHVRQCERWGPLFIPAYLLLSMWMLCSGRRAYLDNPFEREAFMNDQG
jgi:hypothetical protein